MRLIVEEEAVRWFQKEMNVKQGDHIRFFVRIGGCSTVQSGYSLGIVKEHPQHSGLTAKAEGITFYMEEDHLWYLEGKDLLVHVDTRTNDIQFDAV